MTQLLMMHLEFAYIKSITEMTDVPQRIEFLSNRFFLAPIKFFRHILSIFKRQVYQTNVIHQCLSIKFDLPTNIKF